MRGIEQYLQVDAATLGALKYQGTWDASTNTPTLTSSVGVQGQYYVVSVAGSTNLNGETNWQVGDWAVFNGSVWQKVDGGSTGLLTTLTVTGDTYLATTSGNTFIGTTSQAFGEKFQVYGNYAVFNNASYTGFIGQGSSLGTGTASDFGIRSSNALAFLSGGATERMRLDSSGNLGLGVTPNAWGSSTAFQIGSWVSLASSNTFGTSIGFNNYYNGTNSIYSFSNNAAKLDIGAGTFKFFTAPSGTAGNAISFTQAMTLDASGNLGLGVTPSAWFSDYKVLQIGLAGSVFNDNYNEDLNVGSNAYADTRGGYKFIRTGYAQRYVQTNGGQHQWLTSSASGTAGNAISFTQAMTLDASGNWMAGTTTAIGRATVVGGSSQLSFHDGNGSNTNYGYLNYGGSSGELTLNANSTGGNTAIRFLTSNGGTNAERVRIDYAGNLGLGVTPSAWATVLPVLQVNNASFTGYNNQAIISSNYYYNAGNKYIANGFATQYAQTSGQHQWFTAASGTAGNAISFTQAMTLDASGNLLVGTTSSVDNNFDIQINTPAAGVRGMGVNDNGGYGVYLMYDKSGRYSTDASALRNIANTPLVFETNNTERARIPAAGGMVVGTAALATTATDGFLYVPTCAGTPTGTPTTQTGTAPIVVDTTNNKLYFYSGGQWRDAGP